MKAFRYYLKDNNDIVSPFTFNHETVNATGKYGKIPLINLSDSNIKGTINTAPHNGTSIIMAPNRKYSVFGIGKLFNALLKAVARDDKIGEQQFNRYNKLLGGSFDYDDIKGFFDNYLDFFDGDVEETLNYLDSGSDSPVHKLVDSELIRNMPVGSLNVKEPLLDNKVNKYNAAYVQSDAPDKDEDRDYTQLMASLSGTHDALASRYGKNNIGLYQVEYDPEDQFTGKDYLENKETAQVDYPAEGKVKVNRVYPVVELDYDKYTDYKNDALRKTKTPDERNEAFREMLKPALGVDPTDISSDERLKVIKHHNNWLNTQNVASIVQRGML